MKYNKSIGSKLFDVINFLFMIFIIIIMIYPFIHVLSISISDSAPVGLGEVTWIPKGFNFRAYSMVLSSNAIGVAYKNTIIYAGVGTTLILLLSSLAAYPLSKKRFYGGNIIAFLLAITMIFPGGMIPKFLVIKTLGLLDSRWSVILISVSNIWYIVLIRTNFQALPKDLSEAAYIDGANDWRILFQIYIPLSKPILATVALFAIVSYWNSFFHALIFLNDSAKFPLQMILRKVIMANMEDLGLGEFLGKGNPAEGIGLIQKLKMATIIVAIGPIIIVYPFVQKYFVKGVLVGSVKG